MTWLQRIGAFLGVASWSRAALFAVSLAAAAAAGAFWLGSDWQVGRSAKSELKSIQELIDARNEEMVEVRQLAAEFARYRQQQRAADAARWSQLAEWLQKPGIGDQPALDARGIELWNAANAGTAGRSAGPGAAGAVPGGTAAAPGQRGRGHRQGAAEEPQRGDDAGG